MKELTDEEKRLLDALRHILPGDPSKRSLSERPERVLSIGAEMASYTRRTLEEEQIVLNKTGHFKYIG